jgi:hypothetical protein
MSGRAERGQLDAPAAGGWAGSRRISSIGVARATLLPYSPTPSEIAPALAGPAAPGQ